MGWQSDCPQLGNSGLGWDHSCVCDTLAGPLGARKASAVMVCVCHITSHPTADYTRLVHIVIRRLVPSEGSKKHSRLLETELGNNAVLLPPHSIGQSKSQGLVRFKGWGNTFHSSIGGASTSYCKVTLIHEGE